MCGPCPLHGCIPASTNTLGAEPTLELQSPLACSLSVLGCPAGWPHTRRSVHGIAFCLRTVKCGFEHDLLLDSHISAGQAHAESSSQQCVVRLAPQEKTPAEAREVRARMDIYFNRVQALSKSDKLESRVRFALQVNENFFIQLLRGRTVSVPS